MTDQIVIIDKQTRQPVAIAKTMRDAAKYIGVHEKTIAYNLIKMKRPYESKGVTGFIAQLVAVI